MAQSLGQRSVTHKQSIIAANGKISWHLPEKASQFQEIPRAKHKFSQPFLDTNCEFAQTKGAEHVIQFKSLESNRKLVCGDKVYNDDELVKHMSNVPCFLQQAGKEISTQEKALNFGVLDWKKLEKWKYNERMPVRIHKKTSSSSTGSICMASGPPKMSPNLRKQPTSQSLDINSPFGSTQGKTLSSQSSHLNPFKMERKDTYCKEENSFEGIRQPGHLVTAPRQEFQGVQRSTAERPRKLHQKVERYDTRCLEPNLNQVKMKDMKKETVRERKSQSSEDGSYNMSHSSNDTINARSKTSEMSMDDGVMYAHLGFPAELESFLLGSKDTPKRSCSESSQFSEPRMSLDGQMAEAIGNRFSNCFSHRESGEFFEHVIPIPTEAKDLITREKTARQSHLVETPKRPDAKQPTLKGRHPSPTSRFRFGLGKMRNSSFKESSAVPELSSTYTTVRSGPVMEITSGADSIGKEKANSSGKGRSSPLRRLLDPLLNKKDSRPTSIVQLPNGSTSKSLLQISFKNGLPFFKLVVENSSNGMLAAVMNKLPAFGKSDHSMAYTFYSIHEVRKKNMTWIQGSKNKNCDLGWNILGQMNISSIRLSKSRAKNSDGCAVRECVLYGIDKEQVDKKEPEFLLGSEMAAVVLQNSRQKLNDNRKLLQDGHTNSAVVILPGGVHGMPIKGAPSSLISRWRSGGSCDCGGWDVGCKVRVLSNHNKKGCKILESSMSCSTMDRVSLFIQGREQNSKSTFNLEALSNGFYSLELDSSISLLEAFATCVALLTCQKFSEILDANIPGHILEAIIRSRKPVTTATTPTPITQPAPVKYATCRPSSPVGRI